MGHPVHYACMTAPCGLWIPQGSLILEMTRKGPLVYGIRKSYVAGGAKHVERFKDAGRILANGACSSVERHSAVLHLLEKQLEKAKDK